MTHGAAIALAAALLSIGGPAAADTVYRCGPLQDTYSQTPCPQGRRVEADDARTAGQQAAAQAVAAREQARGRKLEQERLAVEAMEPPRAGSLSPHAVPAGPAASAPKTKPSRPKKRSKRHETDDFKAVAPPQPKPARRRQ